MSSSLNGPVAISRAPQGVPIARRVDGVVAAGAQQA